jgi:hypothetical protein
MDIQFPKGVDGGLDFGLIKVLEEGKQVCILKNKGKYEVGFVFDRLDNRDSFSIIFERANCSRSRQFKE